MFELRFKQRERQILHIDADAFFASVEQVLNPALKGKPVLVGGPSGTHGIVSAASYEAKKFGIYAGMPTYLARRKCPNGILVNANFKAYRDFSRRMYDIFCEFTPNVEMVSIDEAFLDISGCLKMHKKSAADIARHILTEVYKDLGITVSCGLASNKTVAKVASSTNKPHKLTTVPFGKEASFLAPLGLRALPGIGPKTFTMLERYGLKTIGDFANLSLAEVVQKFGISGVPLWKRCCGVDNSEVASSRPLPKSISKERTFYEDVQDKKTCLSFLKKLSVIVFEKLRSYDMKARTVFIRIRYKNMTGSNTIFTDFSFQKHLDVVVSSDMELFPIVKKLFEDNVIDGENIRLLGVGVGNIVFNYNLNLFSNGRDSDNLFDKIDEINKLYGKESLSYGI